MFIPAIPLILPPYKDKRADVTIFFPFLMVKSWHTSDWENAYLLRTTFLKNEDLSSRFAEVTLLILGYVGLPLLFYTLYGPAGLLVFTGWLVTAKYGRRHVKYADVIYMLVALGIPYAMYFAAPSLVEKLLPVYQLEGSIARAICLNPQYRHFCRSVPSAHYTPLANEVIAIFFSLVYFLHITRVGNAVYHTLPLYILMFYTFAYVPVPTFGAPFLIYTLITTVTALKVAKSKARGYHDWIVGGPRDSAALGIGFGFLTSYYFIMACDAIFVNIYNQLLSAI